MAAAKSEFLKLFEKLFKPFDDSVKSTQTMGKKGAITFVEWYHYIARAAKEFPEGFSTEIRKAFEVGGQLVLIIRVTDLATGAFQEATGSAPVDKQKANYGGASAEAESQALRRAFAKFGLGLEMYMDAEDKVQAVEPTNADPDDIARLKQLAEATDNKNIQKAIQAARESVGKAIDKAFAADLAVEMVEKAFADEKVDLPKD